jgi:hypothetical protein
MKSLTFKPIYNAVKYTEYKWDLFWLDMDDKVWTLGTKPPGADLYESLFIPEKGPERGNLIDARIEQALAGCIQF